MNIDDLNYELARIAEQEREAMIDEEYEEEMMNLEQEKQYEMMSRDED